MMSPPGSETKLINPEIPRGHELLPHKIVAAQGAASAQPLSESVQQSRPRVRSPANSKSYSKHSFWQNRLDGKTIDLAARDNEECVKRLGDPNKGSAFCLAHAAEAVQPSTCFPIFTFSTILKDQQTSTHS